VRVRKQGPEVVVEITGEGFLKYMVRNIVGTLADVGRGRITPSEFRSILRARDRKKAGATAPAFGLTLISVGY
jgi:tRNA pseudouridine38-40 synthase